MPVHRSDAIMLTRNLLYTAVSRASRALVLVGQLQAIVLGVRRSDGAARFSLLPVLLDGLPENRFGPKDGLLAAQIASAGLRPTVSEKRASCRNVEHGPAQSEALRAAAEVLWEQSHRLARQRIA